MHVNEENTFVFIYKMFSYHMVKTVVYCQVTGCGTTLAFIYKIADYETDVST